MSVTENAAPLPPYYAVIFTSRRTLQDDAGYAEMADAMEQLARTQPGFLGIESARDAARVGITVSYWMDETAIRVWRENVEHRLAQKYGRMNWYEWYEIRICRVERAYGFRK